MSTAAAFARLLIAILAAWPALRDELRKQSASRAAAAKDKQADAFVDAALAEPNDPRLCGNCPFRAHVGGLRDTDANGTGQAAGDLSRPS